MVHSGGLVAFLERGGVGQWEGLGGEGAGVNCARLCLVVLQRVGLYRGGGVVQSVRVVRGLSGEGAGVRQGPGAAVAEEPGGEKQTG